MEPSGTSSKGNSSGCASLARGSSADAGTVPLVQDDEWDEVSFRRARHVMVGALALWK